MSKGTLWKEEENTRKYKKKQSKNTEKNVCEKEEEEREIQSKINMQGEAQTKILLKPPTWWIHLTYFPMHSVSCSTIISV